MLNFIVETCLTIIKIIILIIVGSVKALLPMGVLPRKSVAGEIVLITGAGSGIGRLMAIEFAKLGAKVVLWDKDEKAARETASLAENYGSKAHVYAVDLSKRDEIYEAADKVKKEVGDVDILVNNAGIVSGKKLCECPDNLIELTMKVNVTSHFFTTKAFLPHMLDANHGHIVTIASMAGLLGTADLVDYCASKHAAVGFCRSLGCELALMKKDGVHVTAVCPYYINTGMFNGCETKFSSLFPILEPQYVVDQIMEAVLTNQERLCTPKLTYLAVFLESVMPSAATHILEEYLGANYGMRHFIGRGSSTN